MASSFVRKFVLIFKTAVLMLTAHEGDMQEVIALNAGIDDFVAKPIRTHVLLATNKSAVT